MDESIIIGLLGAYAFVVLGIAAIIIISWWRIFSKAGQPGWAAIVPIYNLYVWTKVVQRPGWWIALYFASIIPIVGSIAVLIIQWMDVFRLTKLFGKSTGFGIGAILLPMIFFPILAFGSADYDASRVE